MNNFEYVSETSLANKDISCIESMAFDGCHYYGVMESDCTIIKYNCKFKKVGSIQTSRKYNRLCYDYKSCCFWATSEACVAKIFKLDLCFQEIDYIEVINSLNLGNKPVGISFNCCSNSIVIAYPGGIVEVDKVTEKFVVKYASKGLCLTGILSLCPGYMVNMIKENKQYIYVFDDNYKKIKDYPIKGDYVVKDIIFNPCEGDCGNLVFYSFIIKKKCYEYVAKTILNECDLGFTLCECNFEVCKRNPDIDCEVKDPVCDIMESIALEQTALSHILNAEGEKIQKVIAVSDDLNKILEVNREVNKTIIHVTHLEQVLYQKLIAAIECDHICHNQCKHSKENMENFQCFNYTDSNDYKKHNDYEEIEYPKCKTCNMDEDCYECNKYPKYNEWAQHEDIDIYQQCYKCGECSEYDKCTDVKKCEKYEREPNEDNDDLDEF
ncbi:MAG: hypothetical protein RR620_13845 [Clostridium sp.]